MYYPSQHDQYSSTSPSSSTSSPSPFDYPHYAFQQPHQIVQPPYLDPLQKSRPQKNRQVQISHPYARLFAKKDEVKRRKIWNHALEKSLFNPFELSTVSAPDRRAIYIASLEAHVDQLHSQLLELGFWPVAFSELDPFKGLNSKTAKSMVAGLQHDASLSKLKLLELERANADLAKFLSGLPEEN